MLNRPNGAGRSGRGVALLAVALLALLAAPLRAQTNTAPTISDIQDQTAESGIVSIAFGFSISDAQTPASALAVTATSSNTTVIPQAGIVLGGSNGNRTIQVTPASGPTGVSIITVTFSDGSLTASDTFNVVVSLPSKLFIAY